MGLFDLIRDLRTREPNVAKAAGAMKAVGWICVFIGAWNYAILQMMPVNAGPFKIPPGHPILTLAAFLFLGALFFLSARGIANRETWGKGLGQAALALLLAAVIAFFVLLLFTTEPPFLYIPPVFLFFFLVMFLAQFGVPAWYGIRYLGRLSNKEEGPVHPVNRRVSETQSRADASARSTLPDARYTDSLFPFGVTGTFLVLLAVPMVGMLAARQVFGPQAIPALFLLLVLPVFVGPILYNQAASPFEQGRTVVESYTGGGSLFRMNGSWPFFRLLVYADGVELRVMFHRFFIPYDRMDGLPDKTGFFSNGLLFRSDLPGVPSSIRFYGFRAKGVLALVKDKRERFLRLHRA